MPSITEIEECAPWPEKHLPTRLAHDIKFEDIDRINALRSARQRELITECRDIQMRAKIGPSPAWRETGYVEHFRPVVWLANVTVLRNAIFGSKNTSLRKDLIRAEGQLFQFVRCSLSAQKAEAESVLVYGDFLSRRTRRRCIFFFLLALIGAGLAGYFWGAEGVAWAAIPCAVIMFKALLAVAIEQMAARVWCIERVKALQAYENEIIEAPPLFSSEEEDTGVADEAHWDRLRQHHAKAASPTIR